MQSPVLQSSNSKKKLKIIVRTPTIQHVLSDSSFRSPYTCLSPVLSPIHLETYEKPKIQSSPYSARAEYLDFKRKINSKISKRLELQIKRQENYGIFPKELNKLRQATLKEVSLHRELNLFKKQAILSPKRTSERLGSPRNDLCDDEKAKTKKVVLEKIERKIMHRPNNASISQPEQMEQQNIGDFLGYLHWLNGEGKKKYGAGLVGDLKLSK